MLGRMVFMYFSTNSIIHNCCVQRWSLSLLFCIPMSRLNKRRITHHSIGSVKNLWCDIMSHGTWSTPAALTWSHTWECFQFWNENRSAHALHFQFQLATGSYKLLLFSKKKKWEEKWTMCCQAFNRWALVRTLHSRECAYITYHLTWPSALRSSLANCRWQSRENRETIAKWKRPFEWSQYGHITSHTY